MDTDAPTPGVHPDAAGGGGHTTPTAAAAVSSDSVVLTIAPLASGTGWAAALKDTLVRLASVSTSDAPTDTNAAEVAQLLERLRASWLVDPGEDRFEGTEEGHKLAMALAWAVFHDPGLYTPQVHTSFTSCMKPSTEPLPRQTTLGQDEIGLTLAGRRVAVASGWVLVLLLIAIIGGAAGGREVGPFFISNCLLLLLNLWTWTFAMISSPSRATVPAVRMIRHARINAAAYTLVFVVGCLCGLVYIGMAPGIVQRYCDDNPGTCPTQILAEDTGIAAAAVIGAGVLVFLFLACYTTVLRAVVSWAVILELDLIQSQCAGGYDGSAGDIVGAPSALQRQGMRFAHSPAAFAVGLLCEPFVSAGVGATTAVEDKVSPKCGECCRQSAPTISCLLCFGVMVVLCEVADVDAMCLLLEIIDAIL